MCGILAQINRRDRVNRDQFDRMRDTMAHRGPDGADTWVSPDGLSALGHRRLSIIDLTKSGTQPMSNEDGTLWLSFNGEIYNFTELRSILSARGHRFASRTDSEVILHAYEEWGDACVEHLWGMFAFVLWDEKRSRLFGARDRLGVKPLHYAELDSGFLCGSEIKALLPHPGISREIDQSAVCDYLTYRYIPQPKTIWKQIRKLPPAHAFSYASEHFEMWSYWKLQPSANRLSSQDALDRLDSLLADSVERRTISDVPVGLFLSGGLDSSAVGWEMARKSSNVSSFTIGFSDPENDETRQARQVADHLGLAHEQWDLDPNILGSLDDVVRYFDEPYGASSMLPTFLVSKVASESVKVVLSGDGGDEALAGYNWYDQLLGLAPRSFGGRVKHAALAATSWFKPEDRRIIEDYRSVTCPRFNREDLNSLFSAPLTGVESDELWFLERHGGADLDGIKRLQWIDTHTYLPEEVLTKVDRASMAHGLEVRSPLIDHRLYEWVFSLDQAVYFSGQKKKLLKDLFRSRLPGNIIDGRKRGFSAPVTRYWTEERCDNILTNLKAVEDGMFNRNAVTQLIHAPSDARTAGKKWLLVVFDAWYRQWVN